MLFLISAPHTYATAVLQEDDARLDNGRLIEAEQILNQMTPEERIGQLFLVTFQGDQAARDSDIANLIINYHIGGVVLKHENQNVTGQGDLQNIPQQVTTLTNDLQRLALLGISSSIVEPTEEAIDTGLVPPTRVAPASSSHIPLIIAVSQEGDGYPHSEIWNGLTSVPNNMAIGATWDISQAAIMGDIVGQELSSLGINMLFGPSLDVLENPASLSENVLGTRTFGGDPYWVGQMAQAYTTGVHIGSQSRIAVVPKHFPGYGSSDRALHVDVPTVRKSLEQLQIVELAPFIAVTAENNNQFAIADALLTTHIRYQGFQGNIRATTNPVSFDQQALSTLLAQEDIANWRTAGGVLVSDSLGVPAVEKFYDDTGQEFPHRLIAKDAFLAGNDLLYLDEFALGSGDFEAELANIQDTISWFQERYEMDASFQQLVDTAVLRILQLKLKLYDDNLSPNNVLIEQEANLQESPENQEALSDLAQNAITLIAPSPSELVARFDQPPSATDNIIIFSEVQSVQQCDICPQQDVFSVTAIEEQILSLYGPTSSGQISPEQISSFSFSALDEFLAEGGEPILYPTEPITNTITISPDATPTAEGDLTPTPSATPLPPDAYLVQEALPNANWIIFGLTNNSHDTSTLSNFLAQRPDLARNSNVVVFAYTVPYLLDSTEISQLAAYFGVYSKSEPFIDSSVRALFQELPLTGNSPVDIPNVRYFLNEQTQPNASQQIDLFVVNEDGEPLGLSDEPLDLTVGDTIRLQTGTILDNNNNAVPDNTIVTFNQRDLVEGTLSIIAEVPTENGVAQLDYLLEARTEDGQFQITAVSGDALISVEINISVGAVEGAAQLSVSTPIPPPTEIPTNTPIPTTTPTPTITVTPIPTTTPTPTPLPPPPIEPGVQISLPEIQVFLGMMLGLAAVAGTNLFFTPSKVNLTHLIGRLMWGLVGGLLFYILTLLAFEETAVFLTLGNWSGLISTLVGGSVGLSLYQFFK
ncbi:MAG: glycoside hydrolase family 3 N-terminal domain-containing protein [Chloroflexota bacterium]